MGKLSALLNCVVVALALGAGYAGVEQRIAEESKVVGDKVALARRITEPKVWTSANGETLSYRLHVPAKPQEGRKHPLVIHMHGAGSRGTDNAKQMNAGGSDFLSWMTRHGEECVFLAPQCPSGKRWVDVDWGTREHRMHETPTCFLRMAMEIVEDAMTRYPVDPDRVYVMGISMGGYATWELLQRRPDWFAAALPCCGGGDVTLAARMKDVAIWTFHGEVDSVVPVYRGRSMVEALKRVGGNVRYREYPRTNHNAWTPTFTDDTVFDWLWAQRRVASDPAAAAFGGDRPFQHIVANGILSGRPDLVLPDSEFRSNAVPVYVIDPVEKEKDVWIYDMNTLDKRLLKDANGVERPFWVRRIARPFRTRMFYFGDVLDDRKLLDAWCAKHPGFLGFLQLEWVNDSMMPWQAYVKMGHRKDPVQRVTPEAAESIRHRPEYVSAWAAATNRETFARDFLKGHYRKVLSMHANALDRFWMGDGIYTADHLLADWGVRGIVFETTENYSFWQIPLMFVRGAATQYGLDYIWYLASFYRGIDSDGTISGNNRGQAKADEPTNGISVSSMKRVMYLAYFSGALGWQREGGRGVYVYTRNPDESKNGTYGPEGRLLEPFHAFVRDNPRGESYRTTAIVVPISRGYSRFGGKAFRRFDYTRGEYTLDALMSVILDYPSNMTETLYRSGTERVMANSKYGDVFDVLCPDGERRETFAAALAKYRVAVVVDDFREEDRAALERDLAAFEAKGGKVVRISQDMVPWTTPDAALGTVTGATCHPVRRPEIERLMDEAVLPTLPFAVKGAVQFGFNRTSDGWLVYLINNGGVVKFGDRAEEIAPGGADVTVELGGAGGFKVRELLTGRALGVSGDRSVSLSVPNGDVRVLKIGEVK